MKNARQEMILEIIRTQDIETQDELVAKLKESGFSVTQATISRDIRQLELRKEIGRNGKSCYASSSGSRDVKDRYLRTLSDAFVSAEASGNILVLHTVSGMAMAAAAAIDSLDWKEVLGCIAGDDTVFVALRNPEEGQGTAVRLRKIAEERMRGYSQR